LDSGYSDHIVNHGSFLYKSINLKNPVNVQVGDGRILKETKVIKIITCFNFNEVENVIIIPNVFFVKEKNKNSSSFAKKN